MSLKKTEKIAILLYKRFGRNDTAAYAAALAYNFLFALLPLLLFLTALLSFFHLPSITHFFSGPMGFLVPKSIHSLFIHTFSTLIARQKNPTILSLGAVGFLWGMSGAFRQLIDAFNHTYGFTPPSRKFWKTYLLSLAFGLVMGAAVVLTIVLSGMGLIMTRWLLFLLFHTEISSALASAVHWITLIVLILAMLATFYAYLPDQPQPLRWITPGSIFALVVWLALSAGFSLYTNHVSTYHNMYGSLGAVIILMLYLYFLAMALLLGAELNAVFVHLKNSNDV